MSLVPILPGFGDPSYGLLRLAWQANLGVPATTGWHDLEMKGETAVNKSAALDRGTINRSGMTQAPLPGKLETGGDLLFGAPNPNEVAYLYAAMLGKSASPTSPETGAYLHKLDRLETGVTFAPWLSAMAWRNDGMGQRFADCLLDSLELTWAEKAVLSVTAKFVATRGDYWADDAPQGSGTGTAVPMLRGINALNFNADNALNNVWVKVTATATGTVTVKAKVGDATVYGSGTQVITRGVWTQLRDQTGALMGDAANPIEYYMPATGSIDASAPDEAKFLWRRDQWAPSYADPTLVPNETYSRVYIDGTETEIQSGKLTITKPSAAMHGFGRAAARRTRTRGNQKVMLSFSREYLDLEVRRRIETGKPFAWVLDLRSPAGIGTTGNLFYGFRFTGLNCVPTTNTPASNQSPTKSDESMEAQLAPSSDGTYPADLTVEILNSIPDLSV